MVFCLGSNFLFKSFLTGSDSRRCRIFQIVFTAGGLLSRSSHPSFSLEILSHNCRVSHLKSSKSPWPIFSSSGQIRFKFAASRIIMIIMHFRELESGGGKMRINALFDDQEVVHERYRFRVIMGNTVP